MDKANFISCMLWIKRGVSKEEPDKTAFTKEELKRVIDEAKRKIEPAGTSDVQMRDANEDDEDAIIDRYNLEDYGDDDEDDGGAALDFANLTVYASNEEDPYLDRTHNESESDEEEENFKIKPSDNMLLLGHVEKDSAILEAYVYNKDDLYVHHDIILSSYPICFEWLSYDSSVNNGVNYVAMGDMSEDISVWDMDKVNCLEPVYKLTGHKDSILSLSWNVNAKKVLASGSADKTVRLWDLETKKLAHKFKAFKGKIHSIQFHPTEVKTLLIGDESGSISEVDCQSQDTRTWKIPDHENCEIEKVLWNKSLTNTFFISTDNGFVYCYDRRTDDPIYSIKAHSSCVSGLALSSSCPGCLVTASSDKKLKIWDVSGGIEASFIAEYPSVKVGKILCLSANPDEPFIFAVGGSKKSDNFKVIDIQKSKSGKSFTLKAIIYNS